MPMPLSLMQTAEVLSQVFRWKNPLSATEQRLSPAMSAIWFMKLQSLNSMCTILKKGLRLNAFWQKQVIMIVSRMQKKRKSISLQMCRFVKTEVKLQLERKKDLLYMI